MTYTVLVRNELTGHAHAEGTFATIEEASNSAKDKAQRSRKFVEFEVWKGTPRNLVAPLTPEIKFRGAA